jgi:hypothetical protein
MDNIVLLVLQPGIHAQYPNLCTNHCLTLDDVHCTIWENYGTKVMANIPFGLGSGNNQRPPV